MTQVVTGVHCIVELYGCPSDLLNDVLHVRETISEASRQGMSTLLDLSSHQFEPQGVTAVALLAESHISIHTWPELGYAAVDAFTCGEHSDPERAIRFIAQQLQATHYDLQVLPRGQKAVAEAKRQAQMQAQAQAETLVEVETAVEAPAA